MKQRISIMSFASLHASETASRHWHCLLRRVYVSTFQSSQAFWLLPSYLTLAFEP